MKMKVPGMKRMIRSILFLGVLFFPGVVFAAEVRSRVHSFDRHEDVQGRPINAHGGSILFHKGVYYWYGIALAQTLDEGASGVEGIRCYISKDFYNWFDEGMVLELKTRPGHDLSAGVSFQRPMVLFDGQSGRYLLYVLVSRPGQGSVLGIAASRSPVGPFDYLMGVRPNGYGVADFTVFREGENKAVLFYVPQGVPAVHICRMSENLVVPEGKYESYFEQFGVGNLCVFGSGDRYFMAGTLGSGSAAGPGFLGRAPSPEGPWKASGNLFAGSGHENGFSTVPLAVTAADEKGEKLVYLGRKVPGEAMTGDDTVFLPVLFEYGRPIVRPLKTWDLNVFTRGFRRSDKIPPTIPERIRVLATADDRVWIGWEESTDDDHIAGYKVYRGGEFLAEVYGRQFRDEDLAFGEEYVYEVSALDLAGNESIRSRKVRVEMGALGGIGGEYFDGEISGKAVLSRLDKGVDFDFDYAGPEQSMRRDGFSIRWTGKLIPQYSQEYTLILEADDSVRMWVDDKLVVDRADARGERASYRAPVRLASRKPAKIKIEYRDLGGRSAIRLMWESASQVREVVPAEALRPAWY